VSFERDVVSDLVLKAEAIDGERHAGDCDIADCQASSAVLIDKDLHNYSIHLHQILTISTSLPWCRTTGEGRHPDCPGKRGHHPEPNRLPTQSMFRVDSPLI